MYITVRDAASIADEPSEHLAHWRIVMMPNGERHFCGIRQNGTTVRVSSAIVEYWPALQRGITQSGRVYQLEGPAGDPDALRLGLAVWCRANGIEPTVRFDA